MEKFKDPNQRATTAKGTQPASAATAVPNQAAGGGAPQVKRKILVVAKGASFTPEVMEYAVNLARRLGYDLIALNLNPALEQRGKFFSPYNLRLRGKFARQARDAWELVGPGLKQQGIHCEPAVGFTGVARAVKDLNHQVKRIDFVITDAGIEGEEITGEIPLPVFSISGYQGEQFMAREQQVSRSRLVGKTIALGLGTVAIYAAVFLNMGAVMRYFTKGGLFAALPVITVFLVSFVHGTFAHNLWSCLGIEAASKVQPRVAPRPASRKRPRPRLRLNA